MVHSIATINSELLTQALSYTEYQNLLEALMAENKTTGPDQSAKLLDYARLNLQRMRRIDKTVKILPELEQQLSKLDRPMTWLYITEGWCGDAAQILGVIEAMAHLCPSVQTRVILRDEHPEVMQHFLTNGAKAIPIVVVLDNADSAVLGHWGPRPAVIQELMNSWKTEGFTKEELIDRVHHWYAQDKTRHTQLDFAAKLTAFAK